MRPPRPALAADAGSDVVAWLVPAYVALILAGAIVFKFGPVMARGHEMSTARAVFTAVNAATLTGFQSTVGLEDFDEEGAVGPVAVLVLMVAGAMFSMVGGGMAVVRILRLPYSDAQVVAAALASLLIAVLAGASALLSADRRMFDALFLATSAFTNSGLYVGRLPIEASVRTQAVLMPVAFFGGLGLPVLMELFDRLTGGARQLSRHAQTVVGSSAVLYLATFACMAVGLGGRALFGKSGEGTDGLRAAIASASAAAINARGAGFAFEFASALPRAAQWLLVALMFVGANPASASGGVKATTLIELGRGVRASLRGDPAGRPFGIAAVWLAGFVALVFAGLLLLVWRSPDVAADRLLFLTVSAASNVGLSHDPVSITGPGLYTLCAVMLVGRVAPLFVLWWMANTTTDAELAVG